MNEAFLLKIAWGILTCPKTMWVQVLKGKYFGRTILFFLLMPQIYGERSMLHGRVFCKILELSLEIVVPLPFGKITGLGINLVWSLGTLGQMILGSSSQWLAILSLFKVV